MYFLQNFETIYRLPELVAYNVCETVITCCAETMRLIIDTMDLHLQPNERTAFLPLNPVTASKLRTVKNPVVHGEIVFQRYEIMRKADVNVRVK